MRSVRPVIAALVVSVGAAAGVFALAPAAGAHGWVSDPPGRQAVCASTPSLNCGDIVYEPQSVEAPKGSHLCSGGSRFTVLDDASKNWPATAVGTSVTFRWTLTAMHKTLNWQYFVGDDLVTTIDGGGAAPPSAFSHTVDLSGHPGRITVLAVWNIGDTANAFYNCIDLVVGGGTQPAPPAAAPPMDMPPMDMPTTDMPTPAPAPPAAGTHDHATIPGTGTDRGTWTPWTPYATGDTVTWHGTRYTCRQSHTSQPDWEPGPPTLALWLPA